MEREASKFEEHDAIRNNMHVFHVGIILMSCLGFIGSGILGSLYAGIFERIAAVFSLVSFSAVGVSLLASCLACTIVMTQDPSKGSYEEICEKIHKDNRRTLWIFSAGIAFLAISQALHVFL